MNASEIAARAIVKQYGAKIEVDRKDQSIVVDSHPAWVWNDTDCHTLVIHFEGGSPVSLDWAEVYERVKMGFRMCTDKECDYCHPEE